ncbi:conserved hypothetical protein [Hyphomicrobiales bacterium]|nr:conserved hypothetical protein [Hyphomicrobiales bacterium]CAH1688332.1 conserved hypothetical protein [Hyphomicrobiales bacterium]
MSKKTLKMSWPAFDASIRIEVYDDKAPTVAGKIWDALPFKTIQSHALITGPMLLATAPVLTLARENLKLYTDVQPGECLYGAGSQNLIICYGGLTEPEGAGIWGKVYPEDLDTLVKVGHKAWANLIAPYGNDELNPLSKRNILVVCERA